MSIQAEMCVIGCMMLEEEAVKLAADKLDPEMFQNAKTRRIFSAVLDQYWNKGPIDAVTIIQRLPGDKADIVKLAEYVPTTRHMEEYIRIVWEDWRCASIQAATGEIMAEVQNHTAEESVDLLRNLIKEQDFITASQKEEGISFREAARQLMDWLRGEQEKATVKTGFTALDRATGGLLRKSATVLAARSGCGKTDYAINLAIRMAKKGYKVQYFTMEMPAEQLMQRILSQLMRVDGTDIRDRNLSEPELQIAERTLATFDQQSKIHFVEEPKVSIQRVRHNIDLYKPDVVFIDHIGLMKRPNIKDQYKALGMISNDLKQLALEKNIAIVELAQMNRQIEGRKDRRPVLSDIRESGDIEQDADYVLCIQPEDFTGRRLTGESWAEAEAFLLKNRHGRPGVFKYHWKPQYHTFSEVETKYE